MSSLIAFCEAAKTLSFKDAARTLQLSRSGLSRQIQALEESLGVPLFRRLNPGLELTSAGESYLAAVTTCLAELRRAQRRLAPGPAPGARPLRVSAPQSFSEVWLVPNLPALARAHPDLELELEAALRDVDFMRDEVDVAVRFGGEGWGDLHAEPLRKFALFALASPALAQGELPLRTPADLAHHTLIHLTQTPTAWQEWLRALDHAELESPRALRFEHVALALSAAEAGLGVALSTELLCAERLSSGRLHKLFEAMVPSPPTYYFVCRPESLADPRVAALRSWLSL
jgi:LysR family glycine cleavage system transcriptional activator